MHAVKLRLGVGAHRLVWPDSADSADDLLMVIIAGRVRRTTKIRQLTDGGKFAVGRVTWAYAFAKWCPSAARCCRLRSKLQSLSGNRAPCAMTDAKILLQVTQDRSHEAALTSCSSTVHALAATSERPLQTGERQRHWQEPSTPAMTGVDSARCLSAIVTRCQLLTAWRQHDLDRSLPCATAPIRA